MQHTISRRAFMYHTACAGVAAAGLPILAPGSTRGSSVETVPSVADLHVHLSGQLSIERASRISKELDVKFGVVEHPGHNYRIKDDEDLKRYLEILDPFPVYKGLQPVYGKWRKAFASELLSQVEYVLMDAMTLPNEDGTHWRIWRSDTVVTDKERFMDRYLDYTLQILSTEHLNVLAAPTFLPKSIARDYQTLWTEKRRQTIVDHVVKNKVAVEISQSYKIPDAAFVRMAKAAGAKFTFGTNSRDPDTVGRLDFCMQMAKDCGLTREDFYLPGNRS